MTNHTEPPVFCQNVDGDWELVHLEAACFGAGWRGQPVGGLLLAEEILAGRAHTLDIAPCA